MTPTELRLFINLHGDGPVDPPVHDRQFDHRTEEACELGCTGCAARRAEADRIREESEHV